MGNYRFRVWDMMMPNSRWFYKLRDISIIRRRKHKKDKEPSSSSSSTNTNNNSCSPIQLVHSHPRKSHHFPRQTAAAASNSPPRKSSKGKPRPRTRPSDPAARSSPTTASSSGCSSSCTRTALQSVTSTTQYYSIHHAEDANKTSPNASDEDQFKSALTQIDLPPIITSSSDSADASTCPSSLTIAKKEDTSNFGKEPRSSPSRRFLLNSPGPKLRIMNSPRVSSKRFGRRNSASGKRISSSLNDSLAIVKSTNDPQRDFRESMVEMIVENKISGSNELEDLLATYLSLNTDEYHDIIVKVFKQIWFDMTDIGLHQFSFHFPK